VADQRDVRRIARSLPGAREEEGRFAFSVENKGKLKGFVWVWLERTEPKKARVPNPEVLAVRVRDQAEKAALLAGDPEVFFTEPHYNGFPAVLVRLPAVGEALLRKLVVDAWRCQAPRHLVKDDPASVPRKRASRRRAPG
jgi:hypothetical protein